MPAGDKPAAEVDVTADLVRRLLADQHPDLAGLPLVEVAAGWDNQLYRLGHELLVRLPRRALAASLVEHEQRWLPELAAHLPVPVPAPVRIGRPGHGYPWSWSICRWLEGTSAEHHDYDVDAMADDLGAFLAALHRPAPPDAPANPYRGMPLSDRDAVTRERIETLADVIDASAVRRCWDELVASRGWAGPPVWLHGDLHPGNLLVDGGRLVAVIDFGDLTAGDPATDLSIAWRMLPDRSTRERFRRAAGAVDDDTWLRARGWALSLALAHLSGSGDDPVMAASCHRGLAAALAG